LITVEKIEKRNLSSPFVLRVFVLVCIIEKEKTKLSRDAFARLDM